MRQPVGPFPMREDGYEAVGLALAAVPFNKVETMRAMGLDVGMKTIGVAVTDELRVAAHPHHTLARKGTAADAAAIAELIASFEVIDLVVGLPLELSGRVGPRARRVQVLVEALRAALPATVRIHEWDERFSTVAVERVLLDANLSRARRKQVVDKQAAAFILQGWLEAQQST
jgi:putative Holliday junction resolvase